MVVVFFFLTIVLFSLSGEWIEQNNLTGECQAGFKKDYSTVDHMFTLMAMIQKQFADSETVCLK